MNQKITNSSLSRKLDTVIDAFTYPRLRISNAFQELIHKVDLKFAEKQKTKDEQMRKKVDENWCTND